MEVWIKVAVRKKRVIRMMRPVVINISNQGSYADIPKGMKADLELTNLWDNFRLIRRSQKRDLRLELKKSKDIMSDKFLTEIGKSWGQETKIRPNSPVISIVCKEIEEATTKKEICELLEKEFDLIGHGESAVKTLRKAYGGK